LGKAAQAASTLAILNQTRALASSPAGPAKKKNSQSGYFSNMLNGKSPYSSVEATPRGTK